MRRSILPTILLLALATAVPAAAQTPTTTTPTATTPAALDPPPKPKPKRGAASLEVENGIATRKLRYVAVGDKLLVRGKVRPFVAGQRAQLEVRRGGEVSSRQSAPIRKSSGGTGSVTFRVGVKHQGMLRLVVKHVATPEQRAFASRGTRLKAITLRAGAGARGTSVLLLQRGLYKLGYAVPVTGYFDDATARAVLAFNKANGLPRSGYASSHVGSLVLRGRGGFKPRFPDAGYHVEFDWSRQVLAFIRDGRPTRVYHSSSGAPATPTVFGTFTFYRKEPGTNHLGMVQSNYFIGGYAIHGYKDVPIYPASHGCLRVPIPNAYQIDRQIQLGMKIMVYH